MVYICVLSCSYKDHTFFFFSAGGNGITSPNAVGVLQWVPRWDNAAFLLLDKVNKKTK